VHVTQLITPLFRLDEPLTSPFLALAAALLVPLLLQKVEGKLVRAGAVLLGLGVFYGAYWLVALNPQAHLWLERLNSPLFGAYLVVILPALFLPKAGRWRLFLLWPALLVLLAMLAVFDMYSAVPEGREGFYWFLVPAPYLICGVVSLLVLVQPLLGLGRFRFVVKLTCALVLIYGGFALRQNYDDYTAMLKRRPTARQDIMNLSETSPVLQSDRNMLHLPSAPCRFSADGGYVQGCNMELFQRVMQVNAGAVERRETDAVGALNVAVAALALFTALCFLSSRWFCGWVCPLSSLGSVLDWVRRRMRLPHLKPARPVKLAYLLSGIGVGTVGMAMARAFPHLDEQGRFAGCKIPVYPFCKVCPSQQMCPVAAHGPSNYSGLPTWEWGWGYFRVATIVLLGLFAFSFVVGRRLWCRFCPMGMISGIFNRGGMLRLTKDAGKCNSCGVCKEVCPMDIDVVHAEMENPDVSSYDCVLCLKCVEKCPKDGCLSLEYGGVRVTRSQFEK